MKTIGTIALALTAALAISACDPYTDENTGPGQIVSVFTSNLHTDTVEGTSASGAWTVSGTQPVTDGSDTTFFPVVWVRFDKLLDGFSIQATPQSCLPAAGLGLTVTETTASYALNCAAPPAPPVPPTWYACYVPNTAITTEGGGVVFYQGCEDIASTGLGWNDLNGLHYGATYRITANVKDKQARTYPLDITVRTDPELAALSATSSTATSFTFDWEPVDNQAYGSGRAFLGVASFRVERADNVATGTPPVDGPGSTWTPQGAALPGTATSFTDGTTVAATKYWYRVTSTGRNTLSRTSDPASNIPNRAAITFANVVPTGVRVLWTNVPLAVSYLLERAPNVPGTGGAADAPGTFATVATVLPPAARQFDDTALTAGTKYWYRVTATAGNGLTSVSANATVTTSP